MHVMGESDRSAWERSIEWNLPYPLRWWLCPHHSPLSNWVAILYFTAARDAVSADGSGQRKRRPVAGSSVILLGVWLAGRAPWSAGRTACAGGRSRCG